LLALRCEEGRDRYISFSPTLAKAINKTLFQISVMFLLLSLNIGKCLNPEPDPLTRDSGSVRIPVIPAGNERLLGSEVDHPSEEQKTLTIM
jgi:hypothetical protein